MAVQTRGQKAKEDQKRAQEDRESEGTDIRLSQDDTVVTDSQLPEESPEGFDDVIEPSEDNGNSSETLVEEDVTDPYRTTHMKSQPYQRCHLGLRPFPKSRLRIATSSHSGNRPGTTLACTRLWMDFSTRLLRMNWSNHGIS
jgi:hypothetical protein